MAKEKEKKAKSGGSGKTLPLLIFLVGFALIVGGVLMQIGYFGGNTNEVVVPEGAGEEVVEEEVTDEGVVDEDATADLSGVDFSITNIENNVPIPIKSDVTYTYAGGNFAMTVTTLVSTCQNDVCGNEGDQVVLKFSTADGKDYPLTMTPAQPTANLIDVPVTVKEWHDSYVVIEVGNQA